MCHIAVFETSDVVKAACHDLPGRIGIVGDALYGHCHFLRFVRVYVYVVGASSFFKTATCAGYYGQTALYGFYNRYAEALVTRRIDEAFCLLVDGIEVGGWYALQYVYTVGQSISPCKGGNGLGIGGLSANENEV